MAATTAHLRLLEDITRDLSGEVNFPTCLDAAVGIRNALRDPFASLDRVARAIGGEPLIASKLLRLANSTTYNPGGRASGDLATAIRRLGFEVVRATALAVALEQMLASRRNTRNERIGRDAWEHSIEVAAIARVLARRIGRINPEEALLAGLVHDIGVFYLLFRTTDRPEYADETLLMDLLRGWHEEIGIALLQQLGLPDSLVAAIRGHDHPHDTAAPCSLGDVLYFANLLAGDDRDWTPDDLTPDERAVRTADRARQAGLLDEAADDIASLRSALAG